MIVFPGLLTEFFGRFGFRRQDSTFDAILDFFAVYGKGALTRQPLLWRHDILYDDTWHNDIHPKDLAENVSQNDNNQQGQSE